METPFFEYTDALGKFLPDTERPNEGVFSLTDDDEQWMSLRYDLTAPLARHFAQNINELQTPYRTYRAGWVFRNEKPGPGRFRQFMQFDADTVGAPGPAADAEMCMMMADTMEALGIPRGDYVLRVNNRKVLDGVMEAIGLGGEENAGRRLITLRAMDKFDKFGAEGVRLLLGTGRWDGGKEGEGDYTQGAELDEAGIDILVSLLNFERHMEKLTDRDEERDAGSLPNPFLSPDADWLDDRQAQFDQIVEAVNPSKMLHDNSVGVIRLGELALSVELNEQLSEGIRELAALEVIFQQARYVQSYFIDERNNSIPRLAPSEDIERVRIDPSCVRGLEYYTGPVYECELTFPVTNEKGEEVVFGSVAGGGRYDGLVKSFTGQDVPATGFSIGVSRLMTALKNLGKLDDFALPGPVLVTVMDRDIEAQAAYQKMVQELRGVGIRAEMFQGNPKQFGKQLQYADRRGSPVAIIQGSDERSRGMVQIKDLLEGARLAEEITDNEEWRSARVAQREVAVGDLVAEVRKTLDAQREG
ncbi:MAG: histidine--tRNA ligase [Rhizobiaceae bacterium]